MRGAAACTEVKRVSDDFAVMTVFPAVFDFGAGAGFAAGGCWGACSGSSFFRPTLRARFEKNPPEAAGPVSAGACEDVSFGSVVSLAAAAGTLSNTELSGAFGGLT